MAVPSSGELRLNGDINLEINGTGAGTNVSLNGLASDAGFSAPNGMFEFYGYVDAVAPTVQTSIVNSITSTSFKMYGNILNDGGGTITEYGFYVGTNSSSPTSNTKYLASNLSSGNFTLNQGGFNPGTTYYFWAFATNSAGTGYGSMSSVTTTFVVSQKSLRTNINKPSGTNYHYYDNKVGGWTLLYSISGYYVQQGCLNFASNTQNRLLLEPTFIDIYNNGSGYSCSNTSFSHSSITGGNWTFWTNGAIFEYAGSSGTGDARFYTP